MMNKEGGQGGGTHSKEKRFDQIQLYRKVDRTKLMSELKKDEILDIVRPANNQQTEDEKINWFDDSIADRPTYQNTHLPTTGVGGIAMKGRIYFERKSDRLGAEERRKNNAKKLKSQMLSEFYKNDNEFKEDDTERSCARGCNTQSCIIF